MTALTCKTAQARLEGLGRRVWMARCSLGLTVTELAKRVSLSKGHVSHIENGRSVPSVAVVVRLALVLEVTTDYILGFDPKKEKT